MTTELDLIRERVVAGLAQVSPTKTEISGSTHILRDLEIDSLAVMNFILVLEEEFDISMPLERVAEVETVDDLAAAIDALVRERQA
jgi:Phosphopantetheine attachment site.